LLESKGGESLSWRARKQDWEARERNDSAGELENLSWKAGAGKLRWKAGAGKPESHVRAGERGSDSGENRKQLLESDDWISDSWRTETGELMLENESWRAG
jgi:hypothetical protein